MLVVTLLLASLLVLGLTVWNDILLCSNRSRVLPLLNEVVKAPCTPSDEFESRLVYIDCQMDTAHTFYTPKEFSSNIYSYNGAFFETRVEMYQWVSVKGFFGMHKIGAFVDHVVVDRSWVNAMFSPERNPGYFPHVPGAGRKYAPTMKLGSYNIPPGAFSGVRGTKQLDLMDDHWYQPSELSYPLPVPHVDHVNTQVFDNALYTGDPLNPKIGDLRITFWGNDGTRFSALGRQRSTLFSKDASLEPFSIGDDKVVLIGENGLSPHSLLTAYFSQFESTQTTYWSLRIASLLLIASTLFCYYYRLKAPKTRTTLFVCSLCGSAVALFIIEALIWVRYRIYLLFVFAILSIAFSGALVSIWNMDPLSNWQRLTENGFLVTRSTVESVGWSTATPTGSVVSNSSRPLLGSIPM
ncbi:transmembrane protein [Babesia ovis]|uniref:Transmembrane protein n=1 Tax=Babesia ovis TaxID=5869 RepID=A0A9W5T8T1_BABOV|nr:transmembrane protein [Babesia ovis]